MKVKEMILGLLKMPADAEIFYFEVRFGSGQLEPPEISYTTRKEFKEKYKQHCYVDEKTPIEFVVIE